MNVSEPSVKVQAQVPASVAQQAAESVAHVHPGISLAGLVRLALARLAGLPGDEYAAPLPMGPKPKQAA